MKVSGNARSVFSGRVVGLGLGRQAWVGSGLVALLCMQAMGARPEGERVVAGSATFTRNGNTTLIQAANNTIINYNSFNIGAGETVRFQQPSATSRVLNRVPNSVNASRIDGSLLSNGIVYIANNAGVFFGNRAIVNVGGLYAAAGQITNQNFLNNVNQFTNVTGTVSNAGTIQGNMVALVGRHIANSGAVLADGGIVTMAAGDDVLIGQARGHMMVRINGLAAEARSAEAGVTNSGTVSARKAMLCAGDMYSLAVSVPGRVRAREITVEGQGRGVVAVTGTLDASAHGPGEVGGTVKVLGERVGLFGANVDASGTAGGGTVMLGGNYQGGGEERRSTLTGVDRGTTIRADATQSGDGGRVIVWSDGATQMSGSISAKGGAEAGDGGFVEVSGKDTLGFNGRVDASAPSGRVGELLLDPTNIRVVAAGEDTLNLTDVDDFGDADIGAGETSINVSALNAAAADITLQASNDITFETAVNVTTAGVGIHARAGDDITVNPGATITTNGGEIVFTANDAGGTQTGDGGIVINAEIDTSGSAGGFVTLDVDGGTGTVQVNADIKTDGGDVTITDPLVLNTTTLIDTEQGDDSDAGDITLGTVSASASGLDLLLDAGTAGGNAGAISVGAVDGSGGGFVNDLTFNTAGSVSDGAIQLNGDISLDADLADTGDLTVGAGSGGVVLGASLGIDTEQGDDEDGGAVDFGTSAASAGAAGRALAINTVSGGGTGGLVTLGDFGAGGGASVAGLTVTAGSIAPLGVLGLSGATSITAATGDITFNAINVGTNALTLVATAGSINEAGAGDGGLDLTAGVLTMTAQDEIGGAAELDIETTVTSMDVSSTGSGDIVLTETDGVTLTDLDTAAGNITVVAGGAVTATDVAATGGNVVLTATAGNLTVATVSASGAGNAALTATAGSILDDGVNATVISATGATLTAGAAIGATGATGQLDTTLTTLTASASAGSVFLTETNGLTLTSVTAAGAGSGVTVVSTTGNITVGTVTAPVLASLTASGGSILDDGVNGTVIGATSANLLAGGAIGAAGGTGQIDTTVGLLNVTSLGASIFIGETDGVNVALASTLSPATDFTLTSTTGDITVTTVNVTNAVNLTATAGAILDDGVNATTLAAATATLTAGTAIGATGANAQLDTNVTSLTASAGAGSIFLTETNGLTLTSLTAAGAGNDINVTSTTGNITVATVTAPDQVNLTANGGAILDDGVNATTISGNSTALLASTVGAAGATGQIDTTVGLLSVSALGGSVFIGETNGLTLTLGATFAPATGITLTSDTGDITVVTVNVPGSFDLTATTGSILDDGANVTAIAAATANLTAGTAIGTALGTFNVDTTVTTLSASAANGGVFVGETNGLTVTSATAAGAGHDVVISSTSGNIIVNTVTATNNVTITATNGSILDDDNDLTSISGNLATLTATGDIGLASPGASDIDTTVTSLDASSTVSGQIAVTESDGLTLTDVDTVAGNVTIAAGGAVTATDVAAVGSVSITAATGDLTVGAVSGGSGTITLVATAGAIVDNAADSAADVTTTGDVVLAASTGIGAGAGGSLDVDTGTITATTATGGVDLNLLDGNSSGVEVVSAAATVSGDVTLDSGGAAGTLTVNSLGTASGDISVNANDLEIAGAVNAGAGDVSISVADGGGIGLGAANVAGGMNLAGAELVNITAANLTIANTAGSGAIEVDSLALSSTSGVSGTVSLLATADDASITFSGGASAFRTLAASADNGITVNAGVTTTIGDLTLDGDADNAADTADSIAIASGVTIEAAAADLVLDATTGGISGTGTYALIAGGSATINDALTGGGATVAAANGITINDDFTTTAATGLDADSDDDGTGTVTVAAGATVSTTGNVLSIVAADLDLPGNLDSGAQATLIEVSNGAPIQLGAAPAAGMNISASELSRMTASALTLGGPGASGGSILVEGIGAADSQNIGALTLSAGAPASTVTFQGAASTFNQLAVNAADGVSVAVGVTTDTGGIALNGDSDQDGTGDVDVSAPLATAGADITITGADAVFSGAINAGAGDVLVSRSAGGTIGVGDATGDLSLSKAELALISADELVIGGATATAIAVDNVATADVTNIGTRVRLNALADNATITFQNAASSFDELVAQADNGIAVNVGLSAAAGNLELQGDADSAADGTDSITFAAGIAPSATGDLILGAATGGVTSAGPLSLIADSDGAGGGAVQLAGGTALSTGGNNLTITAADVALLGTINTGAGSISVGRSTPGAISLGDAAVPGMTIDGTELSHLTCTGLTVGGSSVSVIEVGSVTAAQSAGISGTTILDAAANGGQVHFVNSGSTFNALTVTADDGLVVGADVTTVVGAISMNGDGDAAPDNNDKITIAGDVDITSAGAVTLVSTGGIDFSGASGTTNTVTGGGDAAVLLSAANAANDSNLTVISQGGLTVGQSDMNGGNLTLTADSNNNGAATLTAGALQAANIVLGAGTDANDTIDLNGDVIAGTALTIQSALVVDLSGGTDLVGGSGALNVASGIGGIHLSGLNDETNAFTNGTALISLAPISATNSPDVTVTSAGGVALSTVGINSGALVLDTPSTTSTGGGIAITASNLRVRGTVATTGSDITVNAATTIFGPTTSFTTGGGNLALNGTLDADTAGSNALTVDTGAGDVTVTGSAGGFARLGAVTIVSADDVTLAGFSASSITQGTGTGTTTFGSVTDVNGAAGINLTGNAFVFALPTVATGNGGVTVNNSGALTVASGADFLLDGAFSQTGAGAVLLGAGITTTGDAVSFSAPVTVPGTIAIATAAGAGDITFSSTLSTGGALTLTSDGSGSVRMLGAVTLGGSLTAGSSSGVIQFGAAVNGASAGVGSINATTGSGDVIFDADAGTGTALASVTASGSDVTVHAVRTSGGDIALAANPGVVAGNHQPLGLLTLLGDLQTLGTGNIQLNAAGRPSAGIPSTASIFNRLGAGDTPVDLAINSAGNVTIGQSEKLTVFGNLTINSGGTVRLADISALGNISITANLIELQARPGSLVRTPLQTFPDTRMSVVAAGPITLNAPTITTLNESAAAPKPVFANNAGARGTGAGSIPAEFSVVKLTNSVTVSRLLLGDGTVLAMSAEGLSDQAVTEAIAGAAPRETQSGTVSEDTTVGAAQQELLKQLQINPRGLTAEELLDFLAGRALYNDVPSKRVPGKRDFQVAVNRLPADQVEMVLATYQDAFTREVVDPATGQPVIDQNSGLAQRADNREQIRQELGESLRRFRREGTEGVVDPAQFRAYIEDTPEESTALAYVTKLDNFIRYLELLGLSPKEEANAKSELLNSIRPRSITSTAQLEAIIKGGEEPPPGF